MIYELYSIKDELSDYAAPIPFMDCENAKRYFRTQLEENTFMRHNKSDFSLWYFGIFDAETGKLKPMCELVERGYSKKEENTENGNEEN